MFITLLVLLFSLQHNKANCFTVSTTLSNSKDIKLVSLLKQDLRRNNDDYIDKFNNSKLLPAFNKQSGADNVAKTNMKQQDTDKLLHKNVGKDANRRNIDFSDEVNYNKYSYSPETSNPSVAVPTINPKRFQKATTTPNAQTPLAPDVHPKYVNKANADKLKQFIGRNKGLLQEFISKKREEARTEPMPTLGESLEEAEAGAEPRARSSAERNLGLPAARQLDMAPAKGGKIHSMRLKGRLCQRSVLIPEGPKYDSKGHVYLQAYTPQGRDKDYVHTKPPKLALPKCCNCCKKSVLGCE